MEEKKEELLNMLKERVSIYKLLEEQYINDIHKEKDESRLNFLEETRKYVTGKRCGLEIAIDYVKDILKD